MRAAKQSDTIIIFAVFFFMLTLELFAQTTPLEATIRNLEQNARAPGLSVDVRRSAFVQLGQLYHLSGNLEKAAEAWTDAAFVDPEHWDLQALFERARCLTALGEMDHALESIRMLLEKTKDPALAVQARFLMARIESFHSGHASALILLLNDPAFSHYRPALYYTIWKISGDDQYKDTLVRRFPASPEARIVTESNTKADEGALWFLFPGLEGITME
ncbi:hypothetical protein FACS1894172_18190 [Spirochaetia bacterium]|nr:hypothetical protein FACS1894164_13150 [Spirochaetia bacterium]GHU35872.1 hypothetical protein FACS1894172_18190 [Spirochaetia bacterium]